MPYIPQYTERTFVCKVAALMNKIMEQEKMHFERADVEIDLGVGVADLMLWDKRKLKPALLVEVEPPEEELEDLFNKVKEKAQVGRVPYFALWNLKRFRLWRTPLYLEELEFKNTEYDAVIDAVRGFNDGIDNKEHYIENFLRTFLVEFTQIYRG